MSKAAAMAGAAGRAQYQQMGFDDPNVTGGMTERPEHFKAVAGMTYRVRMMTLPLSYYSASVNPPEGSNRKGFNAISLAPFADCQAAEGGDAAALDRCRAACPLWARGYETKQKWVLAMWVISKSDSRGRSVKVNIVYPFPFAGDKYVQLRTIQSQLPINPRTQQPYPLAAIELDITCTDERWQRMSFTPWTDPKTHQSKPAEAIAALAPYLADPSDRNSACYLVDDFLAPESRRALEKSLDRVEGKDGGGLDEGPDEFEQPAPAAKPAARFRAPSAGRPAAAPAARQRPAAAPAAEPEEVPEGEESPEDLLNDENLGLEEPEGEEAPPPAPPARRAAPAARPAAAAPKPAAKPAAAPRQTRRAPAAAPAAGGELDLEFPD